MTRQEFTTIMAYIGSATGQPMAANQREASARAEVYWDLLGDLPADALRLAAKRVILSHPWATFPSVAELRAAAVDTCQGSVAALTAGQAWEMAWAAASGIDPSHCGPWVTFNGAGMKVEWNSQAECALSGLPPIVVKAMRAFGISAMCSGGDPVSVMRAQFCKIFEGLAQSQQKADLLPPGLRHDIETIGQSAAVNLPPKVNDALAKIGLIPQPATL